MAQAVVVVPRPGFRISGSAVRLRPALPARIRRKVAKLRRVIEGYGARYLGSTVEEVRGPGGYHVYRVKARFKGWRSLPKHIRKYLERIGVRRGRRGTFTITLHVAAG